MGKARSARALPPPPPATRSSPCALPLPSPAPADRRAAQRSGPAPASGPSGPANPMTWATNFISGQVRRLVSVRGGSVVRDRIVR